MEVTTSERYASGGPGTEPPAANLYEAFLLTVERLGDDPAIIGADGESIGWNELRTRVDAVAGGLNELGVGKGDTVALMLNNRPEFIPCDLGAVSLGAVPFSVMERAGALGFVLVIMLFVIGLTNDIGRLTGDGFNVR